MQYVLSAPSRYQNARQLRFLYDKIFKICLKNIYSCDIINVLIKFGGKMNKNKSVYKTIGQNLCTIRKSRGLKQYAFAEEIKDFLYNNVVNKT